MFGRNGWSLRARMMVMAGVIATLANVSVSLLVIGAVHSREADYRTQPLAEGALHMASLVTRGDLPKVLPAETSSLMQVVDSSGQVVAATPRLRGRPPIASFRPAGDYRRTDRTLCPPAGLEGCMAVVSFRIPQPSGHWVVYSAGPAAPWFGSSSLLAFLIGQSLAVLLLTIVITSRAVTSTLTPVDAIRTELAEIGGSDLGHRVPVPRHQDEIRLLAETVNATLVRLEAAYDQLRRFTSDASHDLRSPITAMRAQLEEALLHPGETDWPRMTKAVLTSVERLQAIVTDLLDAAVLDAGVPLARGPIDLCALVNAELDRRVGRVPIIRDLQERVCALGDPLRLTRLLCNLLDNAERHAATRVLVVVRAEDLNAIMKVIDDGAGIALEHRELVFQRFTRLEASRNRDAGGTGLGLPIARQIAEAHDGTLTVEGSADGGACFVLCLPLE